MSSMARRKATRIATSAAATTHMWARDCALVSVGFELIARLPGRYLRPSQIALWKRRSSDQVERSRKEVVAAVERDLEGARYDASLASRRYELVDPAKRHVARELEARWNEALEHVAGLAAAGTGGSLRRRICLAGPC